eukprot:4675201-Prymnesium_polylepis.1
MSGELIHHHMVSVSFWTVNVSGANRLKAHRSSDVCSELTQSAHYSLHSTECEERKNDFILKYSTFCRAW